ncbi:hypothetical protein BHU72_02105 [Desulfuribacillus stibiiarsenatis]|uniref:Bacterial type II secretion system protein E domain-containing protein n=1 Tax=Desulfuribacillus stibiiarsenatis TaxID=1390249 RepID=A0A1E5L657_9FIRM|nr:GspE/PulE family protein [Desulfuribacillus stibiiarsenatis]OEH85615.1 hypothetical protein BHU72_02105 [Desulfuribacillus stibiiarsenatis]
MSFLSVLKNSYKEQKNASAPVDYFVDEIIRDACNLKASDIHFEPSKSKYRIRIRIDGKLQERINGYMNQYQHMINRIKFLANMNIAEKITPQDGALRWNNPEVDMRISTMPTPFGEKCVVRILISQQLSANFQSLGMSPLQQQHISTLLRKNSGLIVVTGPTGSGKSTTLYTSLHYLNHPQHNIITVEDPIEYMIDGINQMQIHEQRGITFSQALRSILRQDPDVIMIGEIRDHETADIAIRASLTGHQILSTLHTNDSVSALYRLMDMNIEPYLLVQGISAILSQRLVRKVCSHCFGKGCDLCYCTGYSGRTGIFEILTMDETITECVLERKSASVLREYLQEKKWSSMLKQAEQLKEKGVIDATEYQELYFSII